MQNQFSRTELLIGKEGIEKLQNAKVAVFGIGGVGSYVVEGLARAGVGHLVLVDKDYIDITNINRQIHATHKTVGMSKVEVMKDRILEINPKANLGDTIETMVSPEVFGRLAASQTKQILRQKIREAEKESLYQEYADKKDEIITGVIERVEPRFAIINIGKMGAIGDGKTLNTSIIQKAIDMCAINGGKVVDVEG